MYRKRKSEPPQRVVLDPNVKHHVRSCHECQVRSLKRLEHPLTISTPVTLFSKIYLDAMHMPETKKGFHDLSGFCEAQALRKLTSRAVAHFLWMRIICRYGIPQKRGHFTLREAMAKYCRGQGEKWPQSLPLALFADRITVSRVTGFSPYQLLHGCDPVLSLDLAEATFLVQDFRPGMTTSDLLAARMRQLERRPEDLARAAAALRKARFRSKEQFERRFIRRLKKEDYREGEMRRVGADNQGGAYVLQEPDGTILSGSVAPRRLLPYVRRQHGIFRANRNGYLSGSSSEDEGSAAENDTEEGSD
ncbi:hypothetical protein GGG16DRAFT_122276 [Schizophyllum commune]